MGREGRGFRNPHFHSSFLPFLSWSCVPSNPSRRCPSSFSSSISPSSLPIERAQYGRGLHHGRADPQHLLASLCHRPARSTGGRGVAFAPFILGSPHCLHEPNLALCLLLHLSMVVEACRKRRGPVDERPSRSCCTSITFLFDPAAIGSCFEGATCRNAPELEEAERETEMGKRVEGGEVFACCGLGQNVGYNITEIFPEAHMTSSLSSEHTLVACQEVLHGEPMVPWESKNRWRIQNEDGDLPGLDDIVRLS